MRKINFIQALMVAVLLLVISGCGPNYGKLKEFNGGQLYYTSNVTENEANSLGQYLTKEQFFGGKKLSVQLNKTGNRYEFRMVAKKGVENDPKAIQLLKQFSKELSINVFEQKPVDIHICDDYFKTIRVVTAL